MFRTQKRYEGEGWDGFLDLRNLRNSDYFFKKLIRDLFDNKVKSI